jgi:hypothetical protein
MRHLDIDAGRYHTDLGFFSANYHYGNWFATTVRRPLLFNWEDRGGPLPLHNVGLTASGRLPFSDFAMPHRSAMDGTTTVSRYKMCMTVVQARPGTWH